jgi:hypothetical protein
VFIMIYLQIWTSKSYETFIDKRRLLYVSSATGITSIAVLVWELWKSQDDIAVLSETWSSFVVHSFRPNYVWSQEKCSIQKL